MASFDMKYSVGFRSIKLWAVGLKQADKKGKKVEGYDMKLGLE